MEYTIFKLKFTGLLHAGVSSLEDSGFSICADTLFSALAIEALKSGGTEPLERLRDSVRTGKLIFSDTFPCIGDEYFVRKPVFRKADYAQSERESGKGSTEKKKFKKLQYIPIGAIDAYFAGDFTPDDTLSKFSSRFGRSAVHTKAAVRFEDETLPYRVGVFGFEKDAGLYVIVGGAQGEIAFFEELMRGLAKCGIGGKRSAGMGKFELSRGELDANTAMRLAAPSSGDGESETPFKRYMTLNLSLPRDEELDFVIEDAFFSVVKRSGFVYSETYADTPLRKNDMYVFDAGSVFSKKFAGDVYDVSNRGAHPVYRCAKPLFLGVNTI
jgi:CRISPR-associated protein Csm4